MKRVAVLLRSLAHGGAEKQALLLTLALRERHAAHLVVLDAEPASARHRAFLATHDLRSTVLPDGAARKFLALRRWLVRERIEALFGFLPSDTLAGAFAGRWAGVERIHGGLRNARLARRKELALRFVHNHVSHLSISNSHAAAEYFGARGFARERLRVIPNAIVVREPGAPRDPTGRVTALWLGRFVPEKDPRAALEALRSARAKAPRGLDLRLCLAGFGPLEPAIRGWIAELGLGSAVELVVDPPEPAALFARADLFLSTSHFEGLSNSILEAMNAGLAVLATDVGDNARLVREGLGGHVVALGDAAALAQRLLELAEDPERRARQGLAGHEHLRRHFSFEAFQQAYEDLLAGSGS
jgi:glycosyltransferase involved in cell wall biosynthesis